MTDFNTDDKISLKYSGNVPEGYDTSEIRFTYDFIYLVYKRDASIDGAIRGVANEYGLSEEYLNDFLIENKYILNKKNKNEFSRMIKQYNTKSLKKILKQYGFKTSGKRDKIEKRIFDNDILGNKYSLSSKSRIFYKNKKRRIRIYEEYLEKYYYFDEFNEFYMDNFRKKEDKIPVEFINEYITKAVEDEDHRMYTINNLVIADVYDKKDKPKKMLEHVLKNYCIDLNPVWKTDDLSQHGGLAIETYYNLMYLKDELDKNRIISAFFPIWDSFNFEKIIVSKYIGYRYLKDILNYKDYHKILYDLDEKYYSNDELKIKKITQKTLFDF